MKVVMVAGEASGDALGSDLLLRLSQLNPSLSAFGIGGKKMQSAGLQSWFDLEELSVMGFVEPLKRLPRLMRIRRELRERILQLKPDVFIGIDAPDFNLGLEQSLRKAGIPIVHYVSPSVWAWRKRRVHKIRRAVDLMLTLFPFEVKFYQEHDVKAVCVGHPLAQEIPLDSQRTEARLRLGLNLTDTYIALLPGSRKQELHYLSPCFLQAALQCWRKNKTLRFITAHINEHREQQFRQACQEFAPELPLEFFHGEARDVMSAANVALIASGTATLEAMLCKTPMVIAYRMGYWTHWLATRLVHIPYVGLPNILAGGIEFVPELIQDRALPDQLAKAVLHVLLPEEQARQTSKFCELHLQLLRQSEQHPAEVVQNFLLTAR